MLYASALLAAAQRRRWEATLRKRAPARLTVAAAADLVGMERDRLLALVQRRLGSGLRLSSELSREELLGVFHDGPRL